MDERAAIEQLQRGDIAGLETLVRLHQVRAIRASYLVGNDAALAEDVVQSAFLRVYERIDRFDAGRPFAPWFLRIVVNDTLMALRRRSASLDSMIEAHPTSLDQLMGASLPGELEQRLLDAETRSTLRAALAQLTPQQRAVVVMRYYLDLSDGEISTRLQVAPGTVRWRLHRARERLRSLLPGWVAHTVEE